MNLEEDAPDAGEVIPMMDFPEAARPKVDHLITRDETPVDSTFFERLMRLLVEVLYCSWAGPGEGRSFLAFANVGLFPEPKQTPVVPDVMVSLDVDTIPDPNEPESNSYFVWVYGKPPDVAFEFVSDKRGGEATHKMRVYARVRVTYYVIFDPKNRLGQGVLRVFELRAGVYQPTDPRFLVGVGLGLVLWDGEYEGLRTQWLRWCDKDGRLLPTPLEAKQRAEQRADRLAEKLRSLGVDPASLENGREE